MPARTKNRFGLLSQPTGSRHTEYPHEIRRLTGPWGLFVAYLLVTGCSSQPDKLALSGAVSFDGEPVANGEIVFTPISAGGGRHATGQIVDGRFDIPEQFGAKPGKYRVSVKAFRAIPGARSTNPYAPEAVPQEQYIPSKFNDQTVLESEVSADQDEYNFDLKSSE